MIRKQFLLPPMESSRRWSPPPAPLQFQNDANDNPEKISASHTNSHHQSSPDSVHDRNVGTSKVSSSSDAPFPPHRHDKSSNEYHNANSNYKDKDRTYTRLSFGSIFTQVRRLPRKTLSHSSILSSARSTTPLEVTKDDLHSLKNIPIPPSRLTNHQRDKNFHLLRSWTDEGHYSRVKAMTIASILYNRKVTEGDIRAELTPKEKFAYKKFCLEIEDKLEMITSREPTRRREPFSERTLRKIWHLYALYTKALSDEIWDETSAKSDITSRAIAHLVKRAIAGGPGDHISSRNPTTRSSTSTPTLKPVDPLESVNPVLASSLKDPIQAFLIVYGRYVSTGKVNQVERLRKLIHFNEIAEEFFQKLVEPPENVDIDTYLLLLRQQQQQFQHQQKWSSTGFTGYGGKSSISMPFTFSHHTSHHSRSSDHRHKKRNKQKQRGAISSSIVQTYRFDDDKGDTSLEKVTQQNCDEVSRRGDGGGSCPPPAISCPLPVEIPPPTDNDVKSLQRKIQMLDG